ncbi:guided entry of tail-anchored proteins factor 1 [Aspergillus ibericus CBS 121593]|uniref:CHD5-like protein n=1 Tax=Aspergillus ibericus CBS 121593 TaxID=1448316 RepID=A0A395HFG0_9EURO|nr:CHD5-like protein [Aspergillus ibericus CBS 121593]RAL05728.1 CHD5-like protein [Aspergillus ibericus CBS 121593]
MLSLLWTVFFIHVAIYLVNTIGASTIDNLLWLLYLKVPTPTAKKAREQNRLKREVVQLKRDMNNTSSQDEFAKWAKLRRRHDKTMEEYESINKQLVSQKSSFDWAVKIARWLGTSGLKLFLQFWYSKTPVFMLPEGWLPYYVAWVLSFPRAPLGSVSIQIWSNVCATAITTMAEVVTAVLLQRGGVTGPVPAAEAEKKAQ